MTVDHQTGAGQERRLRTSEVDAATLRELGVRALGPDDRGEEQLTELDARIAQLQTKRDEVATERDDRARRRRMQRQIIIGYELIQRAAGGDPVAGRLLREIVDGLHREGDRRAFEGWPIPGGGER